MTSIKPYSLKDITHIRGVDHPESIGIGPDGTAYTTSVKHMTEFLTSLGYIEKSITKEKQ